MGSREKCVPRTEKLDVEVECYSIGWKQDYEDMYFDWARRREVEEDGVRACDAGTPLPRGDRWARLMIVRGSC